MEIIVFCKSVQDAVLISGNLGKIEVAATLPALLDVTDLEKVKRVKDQADSIGYLKCLNGENVYTFTWYESRDISLYYGNHGKTCFDYAKMQFNITNSKQMEVVKNIFTNPANLVIYNCAPLPLFSRVYHFCNTRKRFHNVNISELSTEGVQTAFQQPDPYEDSMKAFLSEITAQKVFWTAEYNVGKTLHGSLEEYIPLSFRSIQLLQMLVKRSDEIANFKGTTAYAIWGEFETSAGETFAAKSKNLEFRTKEDALKYIAGLPDTAKVSDYQLDIVSNAMSGLPNYDAMLSLCHKEFGYSQETTESALQELYNSGFITDPHTRKTTFPLGKQQEVLTLLKTYRKSRTFSGKLSSFSEEDFVIPLYLFDNSPEHGILPTANIIKRPYSEEMLNVYTVIVRDALKCVLPNQLLKKRKILVASNSTLFTSTGATLLSKGYTALDEEKQYINDIPENIEVDDIVKATYSVRIVQKSAKPYLTEKDILKTITDFTFGLSEPSSISSFLGELIEKNMVIKKRKNLLPSQTAVQFIHSLLPVEDIFSLKTLTLWYDFFRRIKTANNLQDAEVISHNTLEQVKQNIMDVCTKIQSEMGEVTSVPCPTCSSLLRKTAERYFCVSCGYSAQTFCRGKYISPNNLKYLIKFRSSPILDGFDFGKGRMYLNEQNEILASEYTSQLCPVCRKMPLLINNQSQKYECKNSTCEFSVGMQVLNHTFSDQELNMLLTEYRTPVIKDAFRNGEQLKGFFFISRDKTIKFKKI